MIDPIETRIDPLGHPLHFVVVTGANKPVGRDGAPQNGPALEITLLRFGEQRGQLIDSNKDCFGGEHRFAQFCPTIDVSLGEIRVFKQSSEPRVLLIIELRPEPFLCQPPLLAVRIAKTQVPIPNRSHPDPALAIFVIKGAEAKTIHVLGRFHNDVMVNKRRCIEERSIPTRAISKLRPIERHFGFVHIIFQPRFLHTREFIRLRVYKEKLIAEKRRAEALFFRNRLHACHH